MFLTRTWSPNYVITNRVHIEANRDANPAVVEINNLADATFKITGTKRYVPLVTKPIL